MTPDRIERLIRILAWLLLAAIVIVTLGPIDSRPVSPMPVNLERMGAFVVVGLAFAIAYPRHIVLVALLLLGAALGLEVLQNIVHGRHGRVPDAMVKIVGGSLGIGGGWLLTRWTQTRWPPKPRAAQVAPPNDQLS